METSDYYWSSSQYFGDGNNHAWHQRFSSGYQDYYGTMNDSFYVRAIRAF